MGDAQDPIMGDASSSYTFRDPAGEPTRPGEGTGRATRSNSLSSQFSLAPEEELRRGSSLDGYRKLPNVDDVDKDEEAKEEEDNVEADRALNDKFEKQDDIFSIWGKRLYNRQSESRDNKLRATLGCATCACVILLIVVTWLVLLTASGQKGEMAVIDEPLSKAGMPETNSRVRDRIGRDGHATRALTQPPTPLPTNYYSELSLRGYPEESDPTLATASSPTNFPTLGPASQPTRSPSPGLTSNPVATIAPASFRTHFRKEENEAADKGSIVTLKSSAAAKTASKPSAKEGNLKEKLTANSEPGLVSTSPKSSC
mmetsp:Transcript_68404/g.154728  ORF Transcript_68404/g.154728 Transcript_68404/m.154728 type:complete len:314 (+) Transcript_68404:267-1208(+)